MKWFRRHLAAKLLLLIFSIAVVPYIAVLVYNHFSEERLYTEHFLKEHREQMARAAGNVEALFAQLYRELAFLAGSVVMDDILVNDLDGRIVSLLERYKAIYDIRINLLAIDMGGRVVASTRPPHTGEPYEYYRAFEAGVGRASPVMAGENLLLLEMPVHAGIGRERVIGYVVMEYRLNNLERFNLQTRQVSTVLFDQNASRILGPEAPQFPVTGKTGIRQSKEAIWLYETLAPKLPGWYIGYRIDRTAPLTGIPGLNRFLVLMLLFGVAAIAAAAFWFSRRIVAPLGVLQRRASEMVRTQRGVGRRDRPARRLVQYASRRYQDGLRGAAAGEHLPTQAPDADDRALQPAHADGGGERVPQNGTGAAQNDRPGIQRAIQPARRRADDAVAVRV